MMVSWRTAFIPVFTWAPAHRAVGAAAQRTRNTTLLKRSAFLPFSRSRILSACRPAFAPMPTGETAVVASAAADPAAAVAVAPEAPVEKFLKDYKKPNYLVDNIRLVFDLDNDGLDTTVYSKLDVRRDCPADTPFLLDGEYIELVPGSLKIDGTTLQENQFEIDTKKGCLTINAASLPAADTFVLESSVRIKPAKNTALEGLYMSSGTYCTQCEAEGFRRITYFPGVFCAKFAYLRFIPAIYSRF